MLGYREVAKLLKSAFHRNERIPIWLLHIGTMRKNTKFTAFFDGNVFAGLLYTMENDKYYFILYLAVNDEVRSRGYGTAILDYAQQQAGGKSIVLNVEPLNLEASNYEQRKRRIAFYERNGIFDTGYELYDKRESYAVLSSKADSFEPKEYAKLLGGMTLKRREKYKRIIL